MITTAVLYIILYAAAALFVIACVVRAIRYARLPIHLRWELYPVPHEPKKRAEHGGSYFEEVNWWTHARKSNLAGDVGFMLSEILFLKGLWEYRRKMWFRSYPFHLGLYFLIGSVGMLLSSALISLAVPAPEGRGLGELLRYASAGLGLAGTALTMVGAGALLVARVTDPELKPYTTPGDIFNLTFFLVTLGTLMAGYLLRPEKSPGALAFARGLLTFDTSVAPSGLFEASLVMGALLTAYIPMTHMAHFIAKYFTYHAVRWDDEPNRVASGMEKRLTAYLNYRPTWAAAHLGANGRATWSEIATTNPAQGGKK